VTVNLTDLIRALSERQFATERHWASLPRAQGLAARVAELSASASLQASATPVVKTKADDTAKEAALAQKRVTPEVLVVIAAAVTAFLGKKVRIRSAKVLQSPYEVVNPWSHGRVSVKLA